MVRIVFLICTQIEFGKIMYAECYSWILWYATQYNLQMVVSEFSDVMVPNGMLMSPTRILQYSYVLLYSDNVHCLQIKKNCK